MMRSFRFLLALVVLPSCALAQDPTGFLQSTGPYEALPGQELVSMKIMDPDGGSIEQTVVVVDVDGVQASAEDVAKVVGSVQKIINGLFQMFRNFDFKQFLTKAKPVADKLKKEVMKEVMTFAEENAVGARELIMPDHFFWK